MKWKREVTVEKIDEYIIKCDYNQKKIAKEDEYIVKAVEEGINDDAEITQLIMTKENVDEIIAGLRLAQFIVDYGEFIDELEGHMIIEE